MGIRATYPFSLPQLIDICRQNDVSMIGVFGSTARGSNAGKRCGKQDRARAQVFLETRKRDRTARK